MEIRKPFPKKKDCKICRDKLEINYKDVDFLKGYISERGKILPRRITGACAKHQRKIAQEVKKARIIALLPFTLSK
jgi:small subunit ribosomal protein S18